MKMAESKRNYRWEAVVVLLSVLVAAAGLASGADAAAGVWPSATCTGCFRGCFNGCMSTKSGNLNVGDPFICASECVVHCILSFYSPPSDHTFCTAGCSVSRCSKFSYTGHPNTARVGSCMDSCSHGCSKKHAATIHP